jgi:hypothetical protein
MMVYWIDFAFQSTGSIASYTWRVPTILQCIFLIPMIILVLVIPETPHWLASKDRNDEAHDVLRRMNEHKMSQEEIALLHSGILESVTLAHGTRKASWSDLFKSDCMLQAQHNLCPWHSADNSAGLHSRRRFLIACAIQAFQQLGGINALICMQNPDVVALPRTDGILRLLKYSFPANRIQCSFCGTHGWCLELLVLRCFFYTLVLDRPLWKTPTGMIPEFVLGRCS